MSMDDILKVQVNSTSSSLNLTICSANILFFSSLCLMPFFSPKGEDTFGEQHHQRRAGHEGDDVRLG
jgi:hypothetical protein